MIGQRIATTAMAFGLSVFLAPHIARADMLEANCTGMLNLDVYMIDTELAEQNVENIGMSAVTMDEDFIVLVGDFGEYKFDLNAGTLYHNGNDTSVYCTYSTTED